VGTDRYVINPLIIVEALCYHFWQLAEPGGLLTLVCLPPHLAAGQTLTDSPVKRKLDSQRHKEIVSYEADF